MKKSTLIYLGLTVVIIIIVVVAREVMRKSAPPSTEVAQGPSRRPTSPRQPLPQPPQPPESTPIPKIPVSKSKLGLHIIGPPDNVSVVNTILASCPRLVKWTLYPKIMDAVSDYKNRCLGGTAVLRVYIPSSEVNYKITQDPIESANDYWNRTKAKLDLYITSKNLIDWLEGPNELDNIPNWYNDAEAAQWLTSFWSELADLMSANGYHPNVGSVIPGQPSPISNFCMLSDAMKAKNYAWSWGYHAYTINATYDIAEENKYALYYRKIINQCGLTGIPLLHTEGGFLGDGTNDGWRNHLTALQYMEWVKWFDERLKEDADVVGLAIFTIGGAAAWADFDITPIANELADYLR